MDEELAAFCAGNRLRTRSPATLRHAELIRTALMVAALSGPPLKRLIGARELSQYQRGSGLTAMRNLCGERGWPPLTAAYRH
jgi:hypothetical protein